MEMHTRISRHLRMKNWDSQPRTRILGRCKMEIIIRWIWWRIKFRHIWKKRAESYLLCSVQMIQGILCCLNIMKHYIHIIRHLKIWLRKQLNIGNKRNMKLDGLWVQEKCNPFRPKWMEWRRRQGTSLSISPRYEELLHKHSKHSCTNTLPSLTKMKTSVLIHVSRVK